MSIFRFSVGSDAKSMAVRCVFAIGVVCWANSFVLLKWIEPLIRLLKFVLFPNSDKLGVLHG